MGIPIPTLKPEDPQLHITEWDQGIFMSHLIGDSIFPRDISADKTGNRITVPDDTKDPSIFKSGTYHGTQVALTQTFRAIESRFASYFDVSNFEPSVPQEMTFDQRKDHYQWEERGYPPHLKSIPTDDKVPLLQIFDWMRLLDTGTLLGRIVPEKIDDFIHPRPEGATFAELEKRNQWLRKWKIDVQKDANIGDRSDWYCDAVFAQQQFTGPNPTTITLATQEWTDFFVKTATEQGNAPMANLIANAAPQSLYLQDCSYFREAVGLGKDSTARISSGNNNEPSYLCATVSLFHLSPDGELHPLAIDIDHRPANPNEPVVIFNKRLYHTDSTASEATDWAWRYAKTCAQVSDWMRHEVTIHLTNAHFIEEASIVAAHRAFPDNHIVYELLQPHWLKTLSLNASARSALVPFVIAPLVGCTGDQLTNFMQDAYQRFDWEAHYVPNDLSRRGFPIGELQDPKYRNYVYAKNMALMWDRLLTFVTAMLESHYKSDEEVANDKAVQSWVDELRGGGKINGVPDLKSISALAGAVTMCIHIASPQHTAVNYTQEYYQSFVVNKPPALCTPTPDTVDALSKFTEHDVMLALPVDRPRQWLIASHVPYLLSYRVSEQQNIVNYAVSAARTAAWRGNKEQLQACTQLVKDLNQLAQIFESYSQQMTDQTYPYNVMAPELTATSILI